MSAKDTHTVSLMAEAEVEDGVFEDVIHGTYPSLEAGIAAAREVVKVNAETQAQVIAALPTDPAFARLASLVAMVYRDFDFMDEPQTGIIVETF